MASMSATIKYSEKLGKLSRKFGTTFDRLVKIYRRQCKQINGDLSKIEELTRLWGIAKQVAGIEYCAVEMAKWMNIYREDILAENIKKLYDEDYASHIAPDTQKETRELILGLIGVFKQAWDTSPDTVKESIKSQFKKMALLVIPILETENIINPPKKK
jgi:hypothetical protein